MAIIERKWNSLAEFIDYASGPSAMQFGDRSSRRSDSSYGGGFFGTANYSEAEALAFAWKDGAERIERVRIKAAPKGQRKRQEATLREVGPGTLNMGNYLTGHPQPYVVMTDGQRIKPGRKIVRIMLNVCVSGGVSAATIERRGAGVMALAAALEAAGRRVEISVGMGNGWKSQGDFLDYRILVKGAAAKLNPLTVAFAVAHPSMLRRFFFSAMEREDAATRRKFGARSGGGYGYVAELETDADVIYLGGAMMYDSAWESDAATAKWVREQCEAQGVKFA